MQNKKKKKFFISYNHKDTEAAKWVAWHLEKHYEIISQEWDFQTGSSLAEKMQYAAQACERIIIIISEDYISSKITAQEWQSVISNYAEKIIIPIRVRKCDIEGLLGKTFYIDMVVSDENEALKRLMDGISGEKHSAKPLFKGFDTPGTETIEKHQKPEFIDIHDLLEIRKNNLSEMLNTNNLHGNQHMDLNLEIEMEKEIEIENKETGQKEKKKELVWEGISIESILADDNNYLLINPSGMGKTTFLNYIGLKLLEEKDKFRFYPINTTCIDINTRSKSRSNFAEALIEELYLNSNTSIIENTWTNACFLVDALDQARDIDFIIKSLHERVSTYKKAKIIISSRENTAHRVPDYFKKIRLKLPENDEIKKYLGEEYYIKIEYILSANKELVSIPVLLEMLKTIAHRVSSSIFNKADLYTEFTNILINKEIEKPRFWHDEEEIKQFLNNEITEYLEKIAFFSLNNNEILEISKDNLGRYGFSPEKEKALLNIGILLELFEYDEKKLRFRHQSFQEYFAARYIMNQDPDLLKQLAGDIRYFYNDAWFEVIKFCFGLESEYESINKLTDLVCNRKPEEGEILNILRKIFAVVFLSETRIETEYFERIISGLYDLFRNYQGYFEIFNNYLDKFNLKKNEYRNILINDLLIPFLKDKDSSVRRVATEALGKIGSSKDINLLKPFLKDKDFFVRDRAAEALGKIISSKDIDLLIPLLNDKESSIRSAAVNALGKTIKSKDIDLLIPLLNDKESSIRGSAVRTLGNIGSAENIDLLLPLLKDKESFVRSSAVETLGKIGSSNDIDLLIPLLKKKDYYELSKAVEVLGKFGNRDYIIWFLKKVCYTYQIPNQFKILRETSKFIDIDFLIPLLNDRNEHLRKAAVKALGEIGSSKDIDHLIPFLKDQDILMRSIAAEAFGKIGSLKYIDNLIQVLKSKIYYIHEATEALGKILTSNDKDILLPFLKDKYSSVRRAAITVLGNIGSSKDIDLLIPFLKDKDSHVRSAAGIALGKIISSKDIDLLMLLLKDKDPYIRVSAVKKLGNIGSSKDIDLLIPFLKDKATYVRSVATEALGKIGSSKNIDLLMPLLIDKDYSYNVQEEAAETLRKIISLQDIDLLIPLLKDKDYFVRSEIVKTIDFVFKKQKPNSLLIEMKHKSIPQSIASGKKLNILHISDIHYNPDKSSDINVIFNDFIDQIKIWKEQKNNTIDLIIITGDIAYSGEEKQYESIKQKILDLSNASGCSLENFYIIPGNHDVHEWDNFSAATREKFEKIYNNKIDINYQILNDYSNYKDFLEKFNNYQKFIEQDICCENSFYHNIDGTPKPWYSRSIHGLPIRIIGLHSPLFTCKNYSGKTPILMGKSQFTDAYSTNKQKYEQVIVLTHHPIDQLDEKEKDEFRKFMKKYRVIHLHGHTHVTKGEFIEDFHNSELKYIALGIGSLYGETGTDYYNTYQIIKIDFNKNEIATTVKRWEPDQQIWSDYPIRSNPKKLPAFNN